MNEYLVLVVEDDKPIRNLITTTLKMNDYRYITAGKGNEAIMLSASHKPDIIILDLGLPDIDGVDVIEHIRTWSDVPIIIVSARSEDQDKITALDKGLFSLVIRKNTALYKCHDFFMVAASYHCKLLQLLHRWYSIHNDTIKN